MIKAKIKYCKFQFRQPAATSRGVLLNKQVYFLILYNEDDPGKAGIGECSVFPGLSIDDIEGFEKKLYEVAEMINRGWLNFKTSINNWPSINFAIETALHDLDHSGSKIFYPSEFTAGKNHILINGLIWIGSKSEMEKQIDRKMAEGNHCLKLKIGSLAFEDELDIIKRLRNRYKADELEIRLDANGAFSPKASLEKIKILSDLEIHSIEQPILPSQLEEMAWLCSLSPIPIALDEELIGKYPFENKQKLLEIIRPKFIVLKPGLLSGINSCEEWITIAEKLNIGWWITSSLETNIGLNVIAQWTYTLNNPMHQGLGTGTLFENNIESPLAHAGEKLYYLPAKNWEIPFLPQNK